MWGPYNEQRAVAAVESVEAMICCLIGAEKGTRTDLQMVWFRLMKVLRYLDTE